MKRIFGTDGVRGRFGTPPIDRATIRALGTALAAELESRVQPRAAHVVIGGDTRASTPTVASWISAPLLDRNTRITFAGVVPTPAVAYLVRELGATAGISISASHNPYPDNGVKLFDRHGYKWGLAAERELEAQMRPDAQSGPGDDPKLEADASLATRYADSLVAGLGDRRLAGMRVVVDTAQGAAYDLAGQVFKAAGADVTVIGNEPDGHNINVGYGSTDTRALSETVIARGAQIGFAFDGDADRCLIVDECGRLVNGDAVLYIWARALAERGQLEPSEIVATTMSNLGLETSLLALGISVRRSDVGDREVVTEMKRSGAILGGEQSGHIVHLGLGTTGDGTMTALHIAMLVERAQRPISELVSDLTLVPQTLRNVEVAQRVPFDEVAGLDRILSDIQERLGNPSRVLLRYSGTEPLVRIMIEGSSESEIEAMAAEIAEHLDRSLR
ncbi:MAG: phosphoglucosamine mutase [Acidobacteriota bacterium]|nr:phosphoglucosamine mutase [Acidobacteriota bacterium]